MKYINPSKVIRAVRRVQRNFSGIRARSGIGGFDEAYYSITYPEYIETGLSPREHYYVIGRSNNLHPNALSEIHHLFDANYYISFNNDVADSHVDPLNHYFFHGAKEGRNPNPLFDTRWYVDTYPGVREGRLNPLTHWVRYGWRLGFSPCPWFDTAYYLQKNPDVAVSGLDPLLHYLSCGGTENRACHPEIDPAFYLTTYPDVAAFSRGATMHFLLHGAGEGRNPNRDFDAHFYAHSLPGGVTPGLTPQQHWLATYGREGASHRPRRKAAECLPAKPPFPQVVPPVKVAVIVPVYRGLQETRACIESTLASLGTTAFEFVVINDASPELEVTAYLKSLAGDKRLTVLHNSQNLGFVGTVNRGMALFSDHDVVLLNSDTEVSAGWLDRLVAHAYSAAYVATVTPLSNNATICSYPTFTGSRQMPDGDTVESMDRACQVANTGMNVDIPTGVGFCMYIRRRCLRDVGLFDEEAFGKGYGEENDFCLRASVRGWKHLLALDTYVFHNGEVSFGDTSKPGKMRAMRILESRYPHYLNTVHSHIIADPGWGRRMAITAERFRNGTLPVILAVTHALGGGTEKHVADLSAFQKGRARMLELRPATVSPWGVAPLVRLTSADPADALDITVDPLREWDDLVAILKSFGVRRCHIHHILYLDIDLEKLVRALDVPFDFTVHDYFVICPQVNLQTSDNTFCGEPDATTCNGCIGARPGHGARDITVWRRRMGWLIDEADRVLCPSQDTATRIRRYHPAAGHVLAIPHSHLGEPAAAKVSAPPLGAKEPLRVAVLGVMAKHKGGDNLLECCRLAARKRRGVEFTVIGHLGDGLSHCASTPVTLTGPYEDKDLSRLIKEADPHLIWFPAVWPETYSYTLSAALASGRPVAAVNIGALAERLAGRAWTWEIAWDSSPEAMLDFFERIAAENFRPGKAPSVRRTLQPPSPNSFYETDYLAVIDVAPRLRYPVDIRRPGKLTVAGLFQEARLCESGVLSTNPDPCGFIRGVLPMQSLGDDVHVQHATFDSIESVISDVLFTQRVAIPCRDAVERILVHCRQHGIRIVYDIDDNLFALSPAHCDYEYYRDKLSAAFALLKAADLVTVSTGTLREQLAAFNPRIEVLPNALSAAIWSLELPPPRLKARRPLRLIYMGTSTHHADLAMVRPALRRLKAEMGVALQIDIIGITPESDDGLYRRIPIPMAITESYPLFVRWLRCQGPWDIGIAPLVDNMFNINKSDLKLLDYTAIGATVACSAIGPYAGTVTDGHNGLLVEYGENDWYQALRRLIDDPALRDGLWKAAWQQLVQTRTLEVQRTSRRALLTRLLG